MWIESRTRIIDRKLGTSTVYYQGASCKSENTFGEKDLFYKDNYDFLPIFGDGKVLIFRRQCDFGPGVLALEKKVKRNKGLLVFRTGSCSLYDRAMKDVVADTLRVDRKRMEIITHDQAEREDCEFWFLRTPEERLKHLEALRELNYGPEVINQRLQRVLAVLERPAR
jgi:hypothetical protein